jgi:hypothetical protein
VDTGRLDTGRLDTGRLDTGRLDTRRLDTGRLDTGRLDTGRLDTGRLDTGRLDTGRLDTGRLDTGRLVTWVVVGVRRSGRLDTGPRTTTPGWVDTACWTPTGQPPAMAVVSAVPTSATMSDAGCRLDAPPGRRRLGGQQPGQLSSMGSEGHHAAMDGLATAATVGCR